MRLAMVVVLVFALAGCGAKPDMQAETVYINADYMHYESLADLYGKAELVASVTLLGNTEVRPRIGNDATVHTVYTANIDHVHKGDAPAAIEVKQAGGKYRGTQWIETDSPVLRAGGRYLLFLEVYEDSPASLLNPRQGQYRLGELDEVTPVHDLGLRFTLADLARLKG